MTRCDGCGARRRERNEVAAVRAETCEGCIVKERFCLGRARDGTRRGLGALCC